MYCSKCGVKLSDDSLFCHACGNKVVKSVNVIQENNVSQQTYSAPPEYNISLDKASETGGKLAGIKDKLLTIILVFFFLVAGAIGKAFGKILFKQFSISFIVGLLIGASVISSIQYLVVKKFGRWEDNDKAAWIFTGICFMAHLVLGVYFSIPVLVITVLVILIKRENLF